MQQNRYGFFKNTSSSPRYLFVASTTRRTYTAPRQQKRQNIVPRVPMSVTTLHILVRDRNGPKCRRGFSAMDFCSIRKLVKNVPSNRPRLFVRGRPTLLGIKQAHIIWYICRRHSANMSLEGCGDSVNLHDVRIVLTSNKPTPTQPTAQPTAQPLAECSPLTSLLQCDCGLIPVRQLLSRGHVGGQRGASGS